MKSLAALALWLVPMLLSAQEFAPNSVADLFYNAHRSVPSPSSGSYSTVILSGNGTFSPYSAFGPASALEARPYSWTKTGANTGTLVLSGLESASRHELVFTGNGQGTYRETDLSTGAVIAGDFLLAAMPNGPPPPLANLSVRTSLSGGRAATLGFVDEGSASRRVLVRAVGPSLRQFGVANPAANPTVTVLRGAVLIGANTGWGGAAGLAATFTEAGAFALPASSRDSAILLTLEAGNYTAQARDANGGEVLLEVYVLD